MLFSKEVSGVASVISSYLFCEEYVSSLTRQNLTWLRRSWWICFFNSFLSIITVDDNDLQKYIFTVTRGLQRFGMLIHLLVYFANLLWNCLKVTSEWQQLVFKCIFKVWIRVHLRRHNKHCAELVYISDDEVFRCSSKAKNSPYIANAYSFNCLFASLSLASAFPFSGPRYRLLVLWLKSHKKQNLHIR